MRILVIILGLILHSSQGWASPLRYGVTPWTNIKLLNSWAMPIKKSIEVELGSKVLISSEKTIQDYLASAASGNFDVVQVPAHLAIYLIDSHNFKPIVFLHSEEGHTQVVLISSAAHNIKSLEEATNERVIIGSPLTITTQIAKYWFRQKKLRPSYVQQKDQWKVLDSILSGREKVGAILSMMYDNLSPPLKRKLSIVKRSEFNVNGVVLAAPKLPSEHLLKVRQGLLNVEGEVSNLFQKVVIPTDKNTKKMRQIVKPYMPEVLKEIKHHSIKK